MFTKESIKENADNRYMGSVYLGFAPKYLLRLPTLFIVIGIKIFLSAYLINKGITKIYEIKNYRLYFNHDLWIYLSKTRAHIIALSATSNNRYNYFTTTVISNALIRSCFYGNNKWKNCVVRQEFLKVTNSTC